MDMMCAVDNGLTGLGGRKTTTTPRLKLVEQAGVMVRAVLTKGDPWSDRPCDHPLCIACKGERMGDCRVRSVVYSNTCLLCKDRRMRTWHIDKSRRYMAERKRELHRDALAPKGTSGSRISHMRNYTL